MSNAQPLFKLLLLAAIISMIGCTSKHGTPTSAGAQPSSSSLPPSPPSQKGQPSQAIKSEPSNPPSGELPGGIADDLTKVEAKHKMSADAVVEEFKKDQKAFNAKYKDAVLELSGKVRSCQNDPLGRGGIIWLESHGSALGVRCMMVEKEPWAKVSPGSEVKVKGKWLADTSEEILYGCVFVELGRNPAVSLTAEDLAKAYAADKKKAKEKYHDQWLIVEGEVVEVGPDARRFDRVVVKGDGKIAVDCYFPPVKHDNRYKQLKPGEKIRLVGRASVHPDINQQPAIHEGLLITGK
jgi:hypothetical protein